MRFDATINLGNLLTLISFVLLSILAWRDLTWRIKNLEEWRREHMIDSDSRDQIIQRLDRIMTFIDVELRRRDRKWPGQKEI